MATIFLFTSCIYDASGDKFYRTLWHSEEIPLGPFDVSSLTLEFLCNDGISIKTSYSPDTEPYAEDERSITSKPDISATPDIRTIYGRYEPDGTTAVLENLQITLDDIDITFIEAHRSGDTLFLLWRIEDSLYPFTTALHRLGTDTP